MMAKDKLVRSDVLVARGTASFPGLVKVDKHGRKGLSVVTDDSSAIAEFESIMRSLHEQKWGDDRSYETLNLAFVSGDSIYDRAAKSSRDLYESYKGKHVLKLATKKRFVVVDRHGLPTDPGDISYGDKVAVKFRFQAYDQDGGFGISARLLGVQLIEKSELEEELPTFADLGAPDTADTSADIPF